jgi:hypothetical protein
LIISDDMPQFLFTYCKLYNISSQYSLLEGIQKWFK